jgi:hypothetical protein
MTHIVPINAKLLSGDSGMLAERRLRESPYYFLKGLTCRFSAGVLTLCGTVPNQQLKPIAEAIVWRVPGVRAVVNQVEVVDPNRVPWTAPAARNAG